MGLSFAAFLATEALPAQTNADWDRASWSVSPPRSTVDEAGIHDLERRAARLNTGFGRRLRVLLDSHGDIPVVFGGFSLPAWLCMLAEEDGDDDGAAAANLWIVLSRGWEILPRGASHPRVRVRNYRSALDEEAAVTRELQRHIDAGFVDTWSIICEECGWSPDKEPDVVMAIGAVPKVLPDGTTTVRLVLDATNGGDAPGLNEVIEAEKTRLATIDLALQSFSRHGLCWRSDLSDAFLLHSCSLDSRRFCAIEWQGRWYAFRSMGLGFTHAPHQMQTTAIALVRGLTRRLRRAGLTSGDPPTYDHSYTASRPRQGHHFCCCLPFLDDFGSFTTTAPAAWFSLAHFLIMCRELRVAVNFKRGKTELPSPEMVYLGYLCALRSMSVSLPADKLASIQRKFAAIVAEPFVTVHQIRSLVGILCFANTVIRLGAAFYQGLLAALRGLGPHPSPHRLVPVDPAMLFDMTWWRLLLGTLNARSAITGARRRRVPGELATDASFDGWGFVGVGVFDYGAFPASWRADRIGRDSLYHDIWICELEILALVFALRVVLPRCRHIDGTPGLLSVRVDNLPVVYMVQNLRSRSARCLPAVREIGFLCAAYDVQIECTWIDTVSNHCADVFSRRYSPDHSAADFAAVVKGFMRDGANDPRLAAWPVRPPARPELLAVIERVDYDDYGGAHYDPDPLELARLRAALRLDVA